MAVPSTKDIRPLLLRRGMICANQRGYFVGSNFTVSGGSAGAGLSAAASAEAELEEDPVVAAMAMTENGRKPAGGGDTKKRGDFGQSE